MGPAATDTTTICAQAAITALRRHAPDDGTCPQQLMMYIPCTGLVCRSYRVSTRMTCFMVTTTGQTRPHWPALSSWRVLWRPVISSPRWVVVSHEKTMTL